MKGKGGGSPRAALSMGRHFRWTCTHSRFRPIKYYSIGVAKCDLTLAAHTAGPLLPPPTYIFHFFSHFLFHTPPPLFFFLPKFLMAISSETMKQLPPRASTHSYDIEIGIVLRQREQDNGSIQLAEDAYDRLKVLRRSGRHNRFFRRKSDLDWCSCNSSDIFVRLPRTWSSLYARNQRQNDHLVTKWWHAWFTCSSINNDILYRNQWTVKWRILCQVGR